MKKEQWTDEVMNSVKGLERAEPSPFLFTRIQAKLISTPTVAVWKVGLATVALALLLAVNALLVTSKTPQPVSSEYRMSGFQSY